MKALLCFIAAACLLQSAADAALFTINYRGKSLLSANTTTDQNGNGFTIAELSGVTYRGGSNFTAVMNGTDKLVDFTVTFNADGSIAGNAVVGGHKLADNRDFEGIAFTNTARNSVFLSEEDTSGPAVYEYTLGPSGARLQKVDMPAVFEQQRDNRGLESLTRKADGSEMWTGNEEALTVDGPSSTSSAGSVVRLQRLAVNGNAITLAQQFAYVTAPVHQAIMLGSSSRSGLTDLVITPEGTMFSLERSGVEGLPIFENRIYQLDFNGATDISQGALASGLIGKSYTPVMKTLLFSSTAIGENLEGLCLGPQLANGNRVLLGVVDDGDAASNNTLVAFELVVQFLLGDINQDLHVNALDIAAMTTALTDLNAYKAAHTGLTDANLLSIADLNSDGKWSNADLQGLIMRIKNGNGSLAAVPEPSTVILALLAIGGVALFRSRVVA